MTSPYLQAAYERMKLPVKVAITTFVFEEDQSGRPHLVKGKHGYIMGCVGDPKSIRYAASPLTATRAYLRLCESLFPAKSFPAGSSESCSAGPPTPMGAGT